MRMACPFRLDLLGLKLRLVKYESARVGKGERALGVEADDHARSALLCLEKAQVRVVTVDHISAGASEHKAFAHGGFHLGARAEDGRDVEAETQSLKRLGAVRLG